MKAVHLLVGAALVLVLGLLSPAWAVKTTETTPSGNTTLKLPNGSTVTFKAKKQITKRKEMKDPKDPKDTPAKVIIFELADGTTVELTYAMNNTRTPTVVVKGADGMGMSLADFTKKYGLTKETILNDKEAKIKEDQADIEKQISILEAQLAGLYRRYNVDGISPIIKGEIKREIASLSWTLANLRNWSLNSHLRLNSFRYGTYFRVVPTSGVSNP